MQIFVLVNEGEERVAVVPAKSEIDAVKRLATMMHRLNPKKWSAKPEDYWEDIDNTGAWVFYDGPTDIKVSRPFTARMRHWA